MVIHKELLEFALELLAKIIDMLDLVWKLLPSWNPTLTLAAAIVAWAALAGMIWRLRRLHTHFWIRRRAQHPR